MPGLKAGKKTINNLKYLNDTMLVAENKKDLQNYVNVVKNESRKKELDVNRKRSI